jgi:hypothetical protein
MEFAKANEETSLQFSFVPKMPLMVSDVITLKLPGFKGPAQR